MHRRTVTIKDEISVRHISEILPMVLASYVPREPPREPEHSSRRQLSLFDDWMMSMKTKRSRCLARH